MKYKYKLKNLDCPNCANKIETSLNNDKNIFIIIDIISITTVMVENSIAVGVIIFSTPLFNSSNPIRSIIMQTINVAK